MKVYIIGGQSVGKTTLIRRFQEVVALQVPAVDATVAIVSEVARDLIRAEKVDLDIFRDYKTRQEEFYQFNVKLVHRYLEMAQQDLAQGSSPMAGIKIYDRSGLDAINYICCYLPHWAERMLAENGCKELLQLYASDPDLTMLVIHPHEEFVVQDGTRLPPSLPDLLHFTDRLRELLERAGIPWVEVREKSLQVRVEQLMEILQLG